MSLVSFGTEPQWLAARRGHITSTDIAKILGVSKFGDKLSVYMEKTGMEKREPPTRKMIAGLRYQDAILSDYELETNHKIERIHPYDLGIHKNGILAASLDGLDLSLDKTPVDAKNISFMRDEDGWGEPGSDQIPSDYRLQLAAQMAITGAKLARLAVLVSGWDLRIYEILHDPQIEAMILEEAEKFWRDHIIALKPPSLEGSSRAQEFLDKLYPVNKGLTIPAMEDDGPWMEYLKGAMAAKDNAEQQIDEARVWFKGRIGEADGLLFEDGRRVTWKKAKGAAKVNWEGVARALNAQQPLIDSFTTVGEGSRRFLPKF